MPETLRILLLEDSAFDADFNERALREAGIKFTARRVETREGFVAALADLRPHVILADYALPGFDGMQALAIARESAPDTPFIFVTGALREDEAVETIKQGATDFLLKDRLGRLPSCLQRALKEKELNAQRRKQDRALHESEERYRLQNRILRTINACNQSLVRVRNEADLLLSICSDIVTVGGHMLACVTYADAALDAQASTTAHFGDEAVFSAHLALVHDAAYAQEYATHIVLRERHTIAQNRLLKPGEAGIGALHDAGAKAILALPLQSGDQLLGALTIFSRNPDAFDAPEIRLMEELAADLGYGIIAQRTSLERDREVARYQVAMRNTVAAIARTLEIRDAYTAGHQQRVTALAVAIAHTMGLDENVAEGIYFAAMIHDIGKIAIPAEILSKPGRLSTIEFQLVEGHPEAGAGIVSDIDFPWPVERTILQHHERLDGSGYPAHLKNDEICLEARIIAVADVVEAMSSHRPYRPSLGMEAALAEVEGGAGRLYDPAVVAACVKVVRGNGMQLPA